MLTLYEKIILGCEEAPQVVLAWVSEITILIVVINDYHLHCPCYHLVLGKYFRENVEVELWRANFIKAVLFRGKI